MVLDVTALFIDSLSEAMANTWGVGKLIQRVDLRHEGSRFQVERSGLF